MVYFTPQNGQYTACIGGEPPRFFGLILFTWISTGDKPNVSLTRNICVISRFLFLSLLLICSIRWHIVSCPSLSSSSPSLAEPERFTFAFSACQQIHPGPMPAFTNPIRDPFPEVFIQLVYREVGRN